MNLIETAWYKTLLIQTDKDVLRRMIAIELVNYTDSSIKLLHMYGYDVDKFGVNELNELVETLHNINHGKKADN